MNQQHLNLLNEEFFKGRPISFSESLEGQSVEEGNFVLGCKAGPHYHVSNLAHEMCHFAELEIPRILKKPHSGWGFKYGKYWQIGMASGYEPQTDQSVRREIRTWAYQWSLMQAMQIPIDDEDDSLLNLVSSSVYLHAFANYKWAVIPAEEREEMGYRESENKTIEIMADEVLHLSKTLFTFDNFRKNWNERLELLKAA